MLRLAIAMIVLLAACDDSVQPDPVTTEWSGTLAGTAGFPDVSGTATATSGSGNTAVTVNVTGAAVSSVLPWHIHFGTCANDQGIVGAPTAYPVLQVGAAGTATATATINVALQAGQSYMVNVHASPTDLATIVACGALTRQ